MRRNKRGDGSVYPMSSNNHVRVGAVSRFGRSILIFFNTL